MRDRAAVLLGAAVVLCASAACSSSGVHPVSSTGPTVTRQQVSALTVGTTLWVSGVLTKDAASRWCIRDTAATICATPSQHLQGEAMPATFHTGASVRGELTGGSPATWTAIVMHVG